jgi:hypothetical protein
MKFLKRLKKVDLDRWNEAADKAAGLLKDPKNPWGFSTTNENPEFEKAKQSINKPDHWGY